MNGAESLVRSLIACGIDTCFANPGTSEIHLVAAIDRTDGMRGILCLFEGVVTGAADGYARIADRPAVTLLHLGPGLANGLANLHNEFSSLDQPDPLTERETEVLRLLAQGGSDKDIADNLVIARETVHQHLKNIYGKLEPPDQPPLAERYLERMVAV